MKHGSPTVLRRLLSHLLSERQPLAAVRSSPRAHWFVLGTVCVGAFMGQLDASIVTTALPQLARNLHTGVNVVEWVSLAYSLVLASTLITIGHIADAAGRKLLYLGGFLVFTASSAVCGFAPTVAVLIAARAVQGVGAAMLQANSLGLISQATPKGALGRAIGWQSLAQSMGLVLGPTLGGTLLTFLGWRWLFWVNVPAGVVGFGLGLLLLPASGTRRRPDFGDGVGALLLALGTALPLLYLSLASELGYANGTLAVALVGGVLSAIWFVVHERRATTPLIELSMFRHPALSVGLAAGVASYTVLFGTLSGVSYYFAATHVVSLSAGVQLAALPLAFGVTAPLAGKRVSSRGRTRLLTTAGSILGGGGLLEILLLHGRPALLAGLALVGIGEGLFTPANSTGIVRSAPSERGSLISGVLNTARSIGTALGVALASLLYTAAAGTHATVMSAERGLASTAAALGAIAILVGVLLFLLPAGGRRRPRHPGRHRAQDN